MGLKQHKEMKQEFLRSQISPLAGEHVQTFVLKLPSRILYISQTDRDYSKARKKSQKAQSHRSLCNTKKANVLAKTKPPVP